jgi:hypothetical protein
MAEFNFPSRIPPDQLAKALNQWGKDSIHYTSASPRAKNICDQSGIIAVDADIFMEFALRGHRIVVRAPNVFAYTYADELALGGNVIPKPPSTHDKTARTGPFVGAIKGEPTLQVSDYDLMCIYPIESKVLFVDKNEVPHEKETRPIIDLMNLRLVSKIQHGCNDEFVDTCDNPKNCDIGDKFVWFEEDCADVFDRQGLKNEYRKHGMKWYQEYEVAEIKEGRRIDAKGVFFAPERSGNA